MKHGTDEKQNFVGLKGSKASRAVLVTLLSVFEQCRAFSDGTEDHGKRDVITNMVSVFLLLMCREATLMIRKVVFCTVSLSSHVIRWRT